tara:strand:+ start:321 stop:536 length:216 start_codon:yes stop_codon:yes gene_type:complete
MGKFSGGRLFRGSSGKTNIYIIILAIGILLYIMFQISKINWFYIFLIFGLIYLYQEEFYNEYLKLKNKYYN